MIEAFGSLISSVLGGGATGLLGLGLQAWIKSSEQKHQIELTKITLAAAKETREMELAASERTAARQAESADIAARLDAQTAEDAEDTKRILASHQSDAPVYSSGISLTGDGWFTAGTRAVMFALLGLVDVVRGLMRPSLTIYTMGLLTMVFLWVQDMHQRLAIVYTAAEGKALTTNVVETISYLAVTFGVWWFGGRLMKGRGG